MSALVSPIHTEGVGLANIRYFAPPSGGREFPWPSLDDVFAAMALNRSLRKAFRHSLPGSEWVKSTQTVATPDGSTLICEHYIAQGSIDAMIEVGRCSKDLYWAYGKGGAAALGKLTDGFGKDEMMAYLKAALAAGGGLS